MPREKTDLAKNTTQTITGDKLIAKLGKVTEKEKPKENLVDDYDITYFLPEIPTILDDQECEKIHEI